MLRKKANITPICKKGEKEDPGKYRPVRLTWIPGNVMVEVLLENISKHMKDKKLIRSSQHGFMKEKSCLTKLITL